MKNLAKPLVMSVITLMLSQSLFAADPSPAQLDTSLPAEEGALTTEQTPPIPMNSPTNTPATESTQTNKPETATPAQ